MQQRRELWRLVHSSPDGWRQEMGLERKLRIEFCDILRRFTAVPLAAASPVGVLRDRGVQPGGVGDVAER